MYAKASVRIKACSVALLLGLLMPSALAQSGTALTPAQEAQAQGIIDAARQNVRQVMETYKPFISGDAPYLYDQGAVRVMAVADFNAFSSQQRHQIILPAMLMVECLYITHGLIQTVREPALKPQFQNYLKYLTDRSVEARKKTVDDIPIKEFWEFVGQTSDEANAVFADPTFQALTQNVMHDAIALIIGHETGHLVLKHKDYSAISAKEAREQERAADRFAATLAVKAGISVIPVLATVYTRFTYLEQLHAGVSPTRRTHPLAECRFYNMGKPEFEKYSHASAEDREKFQRISGYTLPQFKNLMDQLEAHCLADDT